MKTFRKTTITVTILTDDPNFEAERLDLSNMLDGAIVDTEIEESNELTGKEMADACWALNSSPSHFFLDDDGNEED